MLLGPIATGARVERCIIGSLVGSAIELYGPNQQVSTSLLCFSDVIYCQVLDNRLGTNGTSASPSNFGLFIGLGARSYLVEGNLVSGNRGDGIFVESGNFGVIHKNLVGTTLSGNRPLPNGGVAINCRQLSRLTLSENVLGGASAAMLTAPGSSAVVFRDNIVGLGTDGKSPLPNLFGILFEGTGHTIVNNTVANSLIAEITVTTGGRDYIVTGVWRQRWCLNLILVSDNRCGLSPDGITPYPGGANELAMRFQAQGQVARNYFIGQVLLVANPDIAFHDNSVGLNVLGQVVDEQRGGIDVSLNVRSRIFGNSIANTAGPGISISAVESEIFNNTIFECTGDGLAISGVSGVITVQGNTFVNNTGYGIAIGNTLLPPSIPRDATVRHSGNTLTGNTLGPFSSTSVKQTKVPILTGITRTELEVVVESVSIPYLIEVYETSTCGLGDISNPSQLLASIVGAVDASSSPVLVQVALPFAVDEGTIMTASVTNQNVTSAFSPCAQVVGSLGACEGVCNCYQDTGVVDCAAKGLLSVPRRIPEWTQTLDLQDNRIPLLFAGEFDNLTSLTTLDLSSNILTSFEGRVVQHSPLQVLRLADNRLTTVTDLSSLPTTEILQLEGNQIANLSSSSFDDLRSLRELDLSRNHLTDFGRRNLQSNMRLISLRLADLPLQARSDLVTDLTEIQFIDLQGTEEPGVGLQSAGLRNLQTVIWPTAECPAGFALALDQSDVRVCVHCPVGTFKPFGPGSLSSCIPCPAGETDHDFDPSSPCLACGPGHQIIASRSSGVCETFACPAGTEDADQDSTTACVTRSPSNNDNLGIILGSIFVVFAVALLLFALWRKNKQEPAYDWGPLAKDMHFTTASTQAKFPAELPRKAFLKLGFLGKGAFGSVNKAVCNLKGESFEVALKEVHEKGPQVAKGKLDFFKESLVLAQLSHPNIVRCVGVVTRGSPMFLVLQYEEQGNLRDFLRFTSRFSQVTALAAVKFCTDIVSGMRYLEANEIVHCDLAARNIFLSNELACKVLETWIGHIIHKCCRSVTWEWLSRATGQVGAR